MLALTLLHLAVGTAVVGAPADRPIARIDRAHLVGAPVLDESTPPGLYVWREDGRMQFVVVGRGTTKFRVRSTDPIEADVVDAMKWVKKSPRHLVGVSRAGHGHLKTSGKIVIGPVKRGDRRVPIFLGPLAERGAQKVKIGMFGALKR